MLQDICNKEHTINVGEKIYKLEFDNKAYARAEQVTGKGLFRLYDALLIKNSLSASECIELFCCGLKKNHTEEEISELKQEFEQKPFLFMHNYGTLCAAFTEPLLPPEIMEQNKKKVQQKKKTAKKGLIS